MTSFFCQSEGHRSEGKIDLGGHRSEGKIDLGGHRFEWEAIPKDTDLHGKRTRIWGYSNFIGHGFVRRHRFEERTRIIHRFESYIYIPGFPWNLQFMYNLMHVGFDTFTLNHYKNDIWPTEIGLNSLPYNEYKKKSLKHWNINTGLKFSHR